MNRISRELLSIAREINALDEEGDGSGFQFFHDQENHYQEMLDRAQKQGKKYILHHKEQRGLWRIQACKDLRNQHIIVKKGNFGGLVKSEKNLSHDGHCWIGKNGIVDDRAEVYEDAAVLRGYVTDTARIYGKAVVEGGLVKGCSQVYEDARIKDNAVLYGTKKYMDCIWNPQSFSDLDKDPDDYMFGYAKVHGEAIIGGHASVNYEVVDKEITE